MKKWWEDSMRKKWDSKYENLLQFPEVNENLKRFIHLANPGRALDIACGMGQNATFLTNRGFDVDCVDISKVGLSYIEDPAIRRHCCDVNEFEFGRYDLIVCFNFLERAIFPKIVRALRPQGLLIYETFTHRSSMNPKFCLRKNELLDAFKELEILRYEAEGPKALLVARKS